VYRLIAAEEIPEAGGEGFPEGAVFDHEIVDMEAPVAEVFEFGRWSGKEHQEDFAESFVGGDGAEGLEAVATAQGHPEDRKVGMHRQHAGDSLLSAGGFDDLEVLRQVSGDRLSVRGIIINDDQTGALNHG